METPGLLTIGTTDIQVQPLGVGTWAWGDRPYWGYGGKSYSENDVREAFFASVQAGVTLFDTAEIYGFGESERLIGAFRQHATMPVVVASKFAPYVWRLSPNAVQSALEGSLQRLGVQQIDLYQIHWPYTVLPIERLMDALADAVAAGKVRAVGVSNYSAEQMRRAHAALAKRGIPLASNQVYYSLLNRAPEVNGVLQACRDLNVTLIAFSPLTQGLLTGKYSPRNPPTGPRFLTFTMYKMREVERLVALMREIGEAHGKTPSQVALNWLIAQGNVLPIPGAKNAQQATQNAGALGWSLTRQEVETLDEASHMWRR